MAKTNKHRDAIFARSGGMCVYCGGSTPATTIDHMPPMVMFSQKQRPTGLEFASCEPCNSGARLSDLACAIIGRAYPDAETESEQQEISDLFRAANNNLASLLLEMQMPRAAQKLAANRTGISLERGGFLRLDGPIASYHLEAFAGRLGLAMHFHATGRILSPEGGVRVRVFSNVDVLQGRVAEGIFDLLPTPRTLQAGKKHVAEQFLFNAKATTDREGTISYASFRRSFSIVAASATEVTRLELESQSVSARILRPGFLRS